MFLVLYAVKAALKSNDESTDLFKRFELKRLWVMEGDYKKFVLNQYKSFHMCPLKIDQD